MEDSDLESYNGLTPKEWKRGERYAYVNAFLSMIFFTSSGIGMINAVFLTLYAEKIGATNFQFSAIPSLWCLSNIFNVFLSYFIEKFRRRKVICLYSQILMSLLGLTFGFIYQIHSLSNSDKIWILLLLVFLGHVVSNFHFIAWLSWFPDFIPPNHLGRVQSLRILVIMLGAMITNSVAGFVVQRFAGFVGFRAIFTAGAIIGLIGLVPILGIPEPPMKIGGEKHFMSVVRKIMGNKGFVRYIIFILLINMAVLLVGVFPTVFMKKILEVPYKQIGLYTGLASFGALIAAPFWGKVTDKLNAKSVMTFSAFGLTLVPILWILNEKGNYHFLPFAQLSNGIFQSAFSVSWLPLLYKLAPPEGRSVSVSIVFLAWGLAGLLAPFLGGEIVEAFLGAKYNFLRIEMGNMHVLFSIQFLLFLICLPFLRLLREQPPGK